MFSEQKKRPFFKRKMGIVLLSVLAVIIIAALSGFLYVKSALGPVDQKSKQTINIHIPNGTSVREIAGILKENGLISNDTIFTYYAKYKNASGFKAGYFHLKQTMDADTLIQKLTSGGTDYAFQLVIPEGKQLSDIAAVIANQTNFSAKEVEANLDDPAFIKTLMKKYPKTVTSQVNGKQVKHPLEGYLFPATYPFYREDESLETIIETMIKQTDQYVKTYEKDMKKRNMSIHDVLTMASLIEMEATEKTDRAKISSVFYNRLKKDMPLQTDPTVLYALGEHKSRVYYKDLKVKSPYNTYNNKGLPPGPIANAGESSWKAALHPEKTDYVYFLAKKNGEVVFTKTLNEHNKAKAKYITGSK
ncbi:endolytic transglycosylase MltG [Bacillus pumilus]|uniref:endolytic transglycosylase MltG n=1 Tax=Bacillus pumilus TaxID=1408 RepID=UPI0011A317FB|nr:endolytic transglycosylase MltG [Bacillus pumilus]